MLPYLTLKAPQARLAVEFQSLLQTSPARHALTDEEKALRQSYSDRLRAMKKEGYMPERPGARPVVMRPIVIGADQPQASQAPPSASGNPHAGQGSMLQAG